MISKKAETLMSDLRNVVHSVSGTDDPYFSIEFAIRTYFLANYIEGLEMRESDYKKRIAKLEGQLLDADESYTFLAEHEVTLANEFRKQIAALERSLAKSDKQGIRLLIENCEYKDALRTAGDYIERLIEFGNMLASVSLLEGLVEVEDWKELTAEWEGAE